jgi:hypothetical protein
MLCAVAAREERLRKERSTADFPNRDKFLFLDMKYKFKGSAAKLG